MVSEVFGDYYFKPMTAKQKIINRIIETGQVDNHWAIDNRITTRLGAVIHKLKKQGWDFETKMQDDKNCIYVVTKKPTEISEINSPKEAVADNLYSNGTQLFIYKITADQKVWKL